MQLPADLPRPVDDGGAKYGCTTRCSSFSSAVSSTPC